MFGVGKRWREGDDPGNRGSFLLCVAPGSRTGTGRASYSKTIQLNSKNFLSLRAGLEAVSSPVIIHLEEGLTWEWKGGFLRWPDQEYVLEGL